MNNIRQSLQRRFPQNGLLQDYLSSLAEAFATSGAADDNFAREFEDGNEGQFWSRAWEAILHGRFQALGWKPATAAPGPDFRLTTDIGEIAVEATVPAPDGLPQGWLDGSAGAGSVPYEAMVLKWTSSLSTKRAKHLADIQAGRISSSTPFVVAINSCRLSRWPDETGISQWPFAIEAVFPVGPLAVPYDRETHQFGDLHQSMRFSIAKKPGVDIPTDSFINPEYSCVSALIGCAQCWAEDTVLQKFGGAPPMFLVPNPLADNPLPTGWLPNAVEYTAERMGEDEFVVKRITHND